MPIFEVTSAYSFTHAVYPCACDVVNINAAAEKLRMRWRRFWKVIVFFTQGPCGRSEKVS